MHWQWTCESLNVQDFVDGIPGRDLAGVDAAGLDRRELARRGAGIVLKMALEDGSFHADPHPGNIIYLRDGRIGVIDFGMVGALSEVRRFQVAQLLHGLVEQDPQGVADVLLDWAGGVEVDENRLQHDISQFVDQYRGVPLKDLRIGLMLGDITQLLRSYSLTLPADLALMIKAFLTLEGMGRQLDPDSTWPVPRARSWSGWCCSAMRPRRCSSAAAAACWAWSTSPVSFPATCASWCRRRAGDACS